ncbi:MAG: transcription-repair coupling factor [Clostridia bacterium]|nr:transcription-repair coupling factor [Clostridia bacterium]
MLDQLLTRIGSGEAFQNIKTAVGENRKTAVYDLCEGARVFLACWLCRATGRHVLVIASGEAAALRMAEDSGQLLNQRPHVLPADMPEFVQGAASRETQYTRMETLLNALDGEPGVTVTTAEALMTALPEVAGVRAHSVRLMTEMEITPETLLERFARAGYERVDMVEGRGQFARRGEIVDVYAPDAQNAVRIEFFDTVIDSIRSFDCLTQRSLDRLTSVELPPAVMMFVPETERQAAAERIREYTREQIRRLPQDMLMTGLAEADGAQRMASRTGLGRLLEDADTLEESGILMNAGQWAGVAWSVQPQIREWFHDPIVVIDQPDSLRSRVTDRLDGFVEDLKNALERHEAVPQQLGLLLDLEGFLSQFEGLPMLLTQDFLRDMSGIRPDLAVQLKAASPSQYMTRFRDLEKDVRRWKDGGYQVYLLAGGAARSQRLADALREMDLEVPVAEAPDDLSRSPVILPQTLSRGMLLEDEKTVLVSDSDIFGAGYRKARKTAQNGEKLEAFTDLREGDYVVHELHGIGIFRGIQRVQSEGKYRDYLKIDYRGEDKLYVPIDQFDRVQKYIGNPDELPPLNSLGNNDWQRQTKKVRAGLKKLAFDLVKLYAARQATPGYAFGPDTPWQRQFEDAFPYELTPDQQRAVRDITHDMEEPKNMDRLLCGDVGYGKTEVALRAAFKAVMDGKQVAFLAPTTILVQQHYLTILRRMGDLPVSVDMLSRFRTAKQQKATIAAVAEGKVDILVGTHRMLSKEVQFKNLGLLIVDEEQRFGVGHKETIKRMKTSVDVLTLSATPIPRTLHMGMIGVRDMSLLETPPEERYPVRTYVIDYNDAVIRDAIRREMNRGGQVYCLYNRVQTIDEFRARLQSLLPDARIAVAHGQMKEHALEDIMLDFFDGRYDVLLSTTIIENGLDVPNANTLIVYDADRFGLSQLYQLRGRVGRSTRMAYAYFTVRPDKMISEDAQKRLNAIREFTEFGSGFRIAMRDLEIRGAGNIFGPEQSGNVSTVGYDMYVKLINEAVREAQSEMTGKAPPKPELETRVDVRVDAFLPERYVRGELQRMEIYKRIALIRNRVDREDVLEELIDRFGDPPQEAVNLVDIAHLRALCARLGINRVSGTPGGLVFRFDPDYMPDFNRLYKVLEQGDERLIFSASKEAALVYHDKGKTSEQLVKAAVPVMENIVGKI